MIKVGVLDVQDETNKKVLTNGLTAHLLNLTDQALGEELLSSKFASFLQNRCQILCRMVIQHEQV